MWRPWPWPRLGRIGTRVRERDMCKRYMRREEANIAMKTKVLYNKVQYTDRQLVIQFREPGSIQSCGGRKGTYVLYIRWTQA
jgi:hypothetical protein